MRAVKSFVLRPRADSASARTSSMCTPGTSVGYCITRCRPATARSQVGNANMSTPSRVTVPSVTSYPDLPMMTAANVDFPAPFGPMTACTSPELTVILIPLRISFPPTVARRFFISSVLMVSCSFQSEHCRFRLVPKTRPLAV